MQNRYDFDDTTEEEIQPKPLKKRKLKKRKRTLSSQFYWLLLCIASAATFLVLYNTPIFPRKWAFLVLGFLVLLLILTGIFTSIFLPRNRFQKFVNCTLAVCLGIISAITPLYINKITDLFESALGNKVRINLYVLTEDYKAQYGDKYQNTIPLPQEESNGVYKNVNIQDYANAVYGTTIATDTLNQEYAVKKLNELTGTQIQTIDKASLSEAVEALYDNRIDILIMSEALASTIEDIPGYENFEADTRILYSIDRVIESSADSVKINMTNKPFTIFFGGNDTTGELSLQGRTDVDMTVTVNPNTHQILIANLPRDSWIPNPYYNGTRDKLTHLGLVGLDNTISEISDIYSVDIENYVLVNFDTFMAIIRALGGITIDNPYGFTAINGMVFPEGTMDLNEDYALMYVRERENLPDGDFGRNMHQQIVMKAIINKLVSKEIITKFNALLNEIDGQFLTNISADSFYALAQKQLDEGIDWNIVNYHITGTTGMEICASAPGQRLSVVYPYDNQITFVKDEIQKVIQGEIITQEELPDGQFSEDATTE